MIQRRELPNRLGSSPIALCTLVARTTSSRRPFKALPTISSDSPREYTSAVSMKLIPASKARWMMRIDSSWSRLPHSPNIIAPRQNGVTLTPVRPGAGSPWPGGYGVRARVPSAHEPCDPRLLRPPPTAARARRPPAARSVLRARLPGAHRRADARHRRARLRADRRGPRGRAAHLEPAGAPRAAAVGLRRRHPLRHEVEQAGHELRRRLRRRPAGGGPAAGTRHARRGRLLWRLHHEPAARRSDRRPGVGGLGVGGPAAAARARRPGAAAGAPPLLLEVGQVAQRPAPARPRRAGLLGDQRLSQPRRSLEGGALLGRLTARADANSGPRCGLDVRALERSLSPSRAGYRGRHGEHRAEHRRGRPGADGL